MKCYVIKWITSFILFFSHLIDLFGNGEFVIFVFWNFRLKPRYFKCSWCDFYEDWHVLPGNLVPTYSSAFLNLKVKLSRKYKNKSVGVRKVVRCILKWGVRISTLHGHVSLMRPFVVYHFQRSSLQKPLSQSEPNFMWSFHGKGKRKFV